MLAADGALDEGDALPPMLPSLLEACGPSAGLSLSVPPQMGEKFCAMASSSLTPGAGPEISFFCTNMKQLLTELTIKIHPYDSKGQELFAVGMLTALQQLKAYELLAYKDD
ncbi:g2031 [Coccomyxa viridis]|uniref:G2031 protein n=1 Tax=Coccomyxa viridis TaxID=1274662 RepID=A0ABP1FN99_9CHLO